jgi:hypothetical protein
MNEWYKQPVAFEKQFQMRENPTNPQKKLSRKNVVKIQPQKAPHPAACQMFLITQPFALIPALLVLHPSLQHGRKQFSFAHRSRKAYRRKDSDNCGKRGGRWSEKLLLPGEQRSFLIGLSGVL